MQPTLAITAPAPGLLSINGRFYGEISPDEPLFAPVHGFGAVYLEYRPLLPGWQSMARKLVLSGGAPMADSLAQADDLYAVRWPGGVIEIELSPRQEIEDTSEQLDLNGLSCRIVRGRESRIEIGALSCAFPPNGLTPQLQHLPGCAALIGDVDGERYILTLVPDFSRQTGFLRADRIDFEAPDVLRAVALRRDTAGHATLERWQLDGVGLMLLSSEPAWEDGAPRLPQSPESAALAAIEAALLGFFDEADSHLTPALRARYSLDAVGEMCEMCLPMKYAPPEGRPCIGLLQVDGGNSASVRPLYYQAVQSGGRWLVSDFSIDELSLT